MRKMTSRRRYVLTAVVAMAVGFGVSAFLSPVDATEPSALAKSRQKLQALRDQHNLLSKATRGAHKVVKYDSARATMRVETNAPALMSMLSSTYNLEFGFFARPGGGGGCGGGPARCTKCDGGRCVPACNGASRCAHVYTPNGKGGLNRSCVDLLDRCSSDSFF